MTENKTTKNKSNIPATRRTVMTITLIALVIFAGLSIAGAFLGKQTAPFFSSIPMLVFWVLFTLLLCSGFVFIKSLRTKPGLLMSHLGCILVLLGAMWGSENAHKIRTKLFDSNKLHSGYMQIFEDRSDNTVIAGDGTIIGTIPFAVHLNEFWIEYYEVPSYLEITTANGKTVSLEATEGKEISVGENLTKIKIARVFQNFKIAIGGGGNTVTDDPTTGVNPALEIRLTLEDGSQAKRYVFPNKLAGHDFSYHGLNLSYNYSEPQGIKDYKSDLVIIDNNKQTKQKVIEVNKPLHYKGYDFYQFDYDHEQGSYTILSVTSDSGLLAVYVGYLMLTLGIIWQCWVGLIPRIKRDKK